MMQSNLACIAACALTSLGTMAQVMGMHFISVHVPQLLHVLVDVGSVLPLISFPHLALAHPQAFSMVRQSALASLIRSFASCWQLSQPFLSKIIYVCTHSTNVNDTETSHLCVEMLTMLMALLQPQLFLDACITCLRGIDFTETININNINNNNKEKTNNEILSSNDQKKMKNEYKQVSSKQYKLRVRV